MDVLVKLWIFHASVLSTLSQDYNGGQHSCFEAEDCYIKIFNGTCYYLFNHNESSWRESQNICKSKDLHMAKLPKYVQWHSLVIKELLREHNSCSAWLGGKAKFLTNWTFVNGVPLEQTALTWSPPLQSNNQTTNKYKCGQISANETSQWNESLENCHAKKLFICRFDDWNGHPRFHFSQYKMDWFGARSWCKYIGADLFYLENGEDLQLLDNETIRQKAYFIGLRHKIWKWGGAEDAEEILYFNWKGRKTNKPNKCLVIDNDGLWNNHNCNRKHHTICQKAAITKGVTSSITRETDESTTNSLVTDDPKRSTIKNSIENNKTEEDFEYPTRQESKPPTKQGGEASTSFTDLTRFSESIENKTEHPTRQESNPPTEQAGEASTSYADDAHNCCGRFSNTTTYTAFSSLGLTTLVVIILIVYIYISQRRSYENSSLTDDNIYAEVNLPEMNSVRENVNHIQFADHSDMRSSTVDISDEMDIIENPIYGTHGEICQKTADFTHTESTSNINLAESATSDDMDDTEIMDNLIYGVHSEINQGNSVSAHDVGIELCRINTTSNTDSRDTKSCDGSDDIEIIMDNPIYELHGDI